MQRLIKKIKKLKKYFYLFFIGKTRRKTIRKILEFNQLANMIYYQDIIVIQGIEDKMKLSYLKKKKKSKSKSKSKLK
jgi:hypothetical protein